MPKIHCAAVDCKYNSKNNTCTAKEIYMSDHSIMTMHDGRQHFWRCKQYEMDEEAKKFLENWDGLMPYRSNENG